MGIREIDRIEDEYKDREEVRDFVPWAERDFARISSFPVPPYLPATLEPARARGFDRPAPESLDVPPSNMDNRTRAGRANDPSTVYGTSAWTEVGDKLPQRFKRAHIVLPCVRRTVRREVMFAKRLAGKGYRTRKRLNENSFVECKDGGR